jgi:hypothetical protein
MVRRYEWSTLRASIAALIGVLALGAGNAEATSPPSVPPGSEPPIELDFDETELVEVAQDCNAVDHLADNGHSIVFDGIMGTDNAGLLALTCVVTSTQPDWVIDVISSTTSQWGLVRSETDGYVVLNAYHPDNGSFVVIYEAS